MLKLRKPYLLFLGSARSRSEGKTAIGVADWCPEDVVGQICLSGCLVSTGFPSMTVTEAANHGAGSLILGTAPVGGNLPDEWLPTLHTAIDAGLDVVSGLHAKLADVASLVEAANRMCVSLIDVRHAPWPRLVGTGVKRTGKRLLTVGTDCSVGKKYTALTLTRELKAHGVAATFRATGQTGVIISGEGIVLDAVIADFLSGVAEQLSPPNSLDHWDIIEGQGSLFHPGYAGVTLGLLHGAQPDAFVLCHDPSRTQIQTCPGTPIVPIREAIAGYLWAGKLTNANIRCLGVSINSLGMTDVKWMEFKDNLENALGLPVADPMRGGIKEIVDAIAGYV